MIVEILFCMVIFYILFIVVNKTHKTLIDDRIYIELDDGTKYLVRKTPHARETAELLSKMNKQLIFFIDKLLQECNPEFKPVALRLKKRYNPHALSEGLITKNYTSYTINKGEQIVLCVRTRDHRDSLYDPNVLMYVCLHELSHIASVGEQHNEEFHRNFTYILQKATEWSMFRHIREKFQYCGLEINGT